MKTLRNLTKNTVIELESPRDVYGPPTELGTINKSDPSRSTNLVAGGLHIIKINPAEQVDLTDEQYDSMYASILKMKSAGSLAEIV